MGAQLDKEVLTLALRGRDGSSYGPLLPIHHPFPSPNQAGRPRIVRRSVPNPATTRQTGPMGASR